MEAPGETVMVREAGETVWPASVPETSDNVEAAAAALGCVTVNVWPPMVSVPFRVEGPVLPSMFIGIDPGPVPLGSSVGTLIQSELVHPYQKQPAPVFTLMVVPVAPPGGATSEGGSKVNVHPGGLTNSGKEASALNVCGSELS